MTARPTTAWPVLCCWCDERATAVIGPEQDPACLQHAKAFGVQPSVEVAVQAWLLKHMAPGHYCDECLPIRLETSLHVSILKKALGAD